MLPLHEVEFFLQHVPTPLQEVVLELRNIIVSVAPDALEVIRWKGLCYFHVGGGGVVSAGICQIGVERDYVKLAFIHGAFIADPRHLLEGTQKAKRFLRIESYESADWDYFKELIAASAKFNPYSLKQP